MNRSLLILLFLNCLLIVNAFGQARRWQKTQLDDSTAIKFPGEAKEKLVKGQHVAYFQGNQAIYSVVVQKDAYDGNPIDAELNKFYEEAIKGTIEASGGGGEIIDEQSFSVEGFSGVQVQYTTPNSPKLPPIKFMRLLLANGTFYSINLWTNTNQNPEVAADRIRFFSSFSTTMRKTKPVDPETQTRAYKLGGLMGTLFAYGMMLAVLVVGFRRLLKPKAA